LVEVPEDLTALVVKAKALKKHLSFNKRDVHNKRGLILLESKIRRLSTYYKKTNRLAQNWRYE
jgi:small subunit ribosomal protein S15